MFKANIAYGNQSNKIWKMLIISWQEAKQFKERPVLEQLLSENLQ